MEYGLFQKNVNSEQHLNSEECKLYTEKKRNLKLDKCNENVDKVSFNINGEKIKNVKK